MRVEVKTNEKKKESGLGLGFVLSVLVLCGCAYYLGGPSLEGVFPKSVERALTNFRKEADGVVEGAVKIYDNAYGKIAGR
jgi:hypothetical protein